MDVAGCEAVFRGVLKRERGKHVRENPPRLLDVDKPSVYGWVGYVE
jgi:hypothetical protein